MKTTAIAAALGASALVLIAAPASAVTLLNGSFELGTLNNPGSFDTLSTGSTALTGWSVNGSIDYIGAYWTAADGSRSLDMSGLSNGSISQTLTTTAGQRYLVSFEVAGNPDGPPDTKTLDVNATGGATMAYTFDKTGHTRTNMGWVTDTYAFTASGASTTLTFTSADAVAGVGGGTPYGPALDNVSIAAVPEPAIWAMMLVGFGGLGAMVRSSRRQQALAAA